MRRHQVLALGIATAGLIAGGGIYAVSGSSASDPQLPGIDARKVTDVAVPLPRKLQVAALPKPKPKPQVTPVSSRPYVPATPTAPRRVTPTYRPPVVTPRPRPAPKPTPKYDQTVVAPPQQ